MVVVEEKKAWVGWQPDGDATAPRRADLQMRREAEQVAESGCIAGSGQEGSALELCYPPRGALDGCSQCVALFQLSTQIKCSECTCVSREGRRLKGDGGKEGGGKMDFFFRLREIVNPVIPFLREKTLLVQKCQDFIIVAVNFC